MDNSNSNSNFDTNKFADFIIENNIIGFFDEPVILKSGQQSNWYVNWRTPTSDVYLINKITDFVLQFVKDLDLNQDCFLGVPEGATKLGVITQFKWASSQPDFLENKNKNKYKLPMGRKSPKSHGAPADKYFVGEPNGRVILLEDVVTTGGSMLEMLDFLKDANINVIAVVSLTDRKAKLKGDKSIADLVRDRGVKYYSLSSAVSLLPRVYAKSYASKDADNKLAQAVEAELAEHNLEQVSF
jgi:orotate phosphoribosyltransferase